MKNKGNKKGLSPIQIHVFNNYIASSPIGLQSAGLFAMSVEILVILLDFVKTKLTAIQDQLMPCTQIDHCLGLDLLRGACEEHNGLSVLNCWSRHHKLKLTVSIFKKNLFRLINKIPISKVHVSTKCY